VAAVMSAVAPTLRVRCQEIKDVMLLNGSVGHQHSSPEEEPAPFKSNPDSAGFRFWCSVASIWPPGLILLRSGGLPPCARSVPTFVACQRPPPKSQFWYLAECFTL